MSQELIYSVVISAIALAVGVTVVFIRMIAAVIKKFDVIDGYFESVGGRGITETAFAFHSSVPGADLVTPNPKVP